jgi:uncharacterized membrane protein YphA (DoxX/SURF4 family)
MLEIVHDSGQSGTKRRRLPPFRGDRRPRAPDHSVDRSPVPYKAGAASRAGGTVLESAVLKWSGFLQLNDTAIDLFTDEFKLHLPGGPYDFPAPAVMAFVSGSGEIIFPVLLVLGLGTRSSAVGLLLMTCIVELAIPDGWPVHLTWAAMALSIMARGPGRLSLDYALARIAGLPFVPRVSFA